MKRVRNLNLKKQVHEHGTGAGVSRFSSQQSNNMRSPMITSGVANGGLRSTIHQANDIIEFGLQTMVDHEKGGILIYIALVFCCQQQSTITCLC